MIQEITKVNMGYNPLSHDPEGNQEPILKDHVPFTNTDQVSLTTQSSVSWINTIYVTGIVCYILMQLRTS